MKRKLLLTLIAVVMPSVLPTPARAAYPTQPIRLIVPYVGGGSTDILARIVAEKLGQKIGQSIVVQNQPGGGGAIGTAAVARANADGYTLVMATNGTHSINPSLYASLPYDAVADFEPVSLIAAVPLVLVVPATSPIRQLSEIKAYAATQPNQSLNFGSAGVGSSGHLASEMLKSELGIAASHIPYKGDGQALVDLIAGRVDYSFANMPATTGYLQAGSLRALAVSTKQRSPMLPDIPTVAEAGFPALEVDPWYGILAPKGTPPSTVTLLSESIATVLSDPETKARVMQLGAQAIGSTPQAFAKVIADDTRKFAAVIQASGARAD